MGSYQRAKLPMLLVFLTSAGCAGQALAPAHAPPEATYQPRPNEVPFDEQPSTPAETLALADQMYESRLGASRGQFDRDRQVAVLNQEILLYSQFLERAEGQPEMEPAVRKSRERIADARATLVFLGSQSQGEAEPPTAPTE